eukprot:4379847-Pleurochrysis_carterae.AAC.3
MARGKILCSETPVIYISHLECADFPQSLIEKHALAGIATDVNCIHMHRIPYASYACRLQFLPFVATIVSLTLHRRAESLGSVKMHVSARRKKWQEKDLSDGNDRVSHFDVGRHLANLATRFQLYGKL